MGSHIPFCNDAVAEPDAPAASHVVCLLSLHLLAETTLCGGVVLCRSPQDKLVFTCVRKDSIIFCLVSGLSAA